MYPEYTVRMDEGGEQVVRAQTLEYHSDVIFLGFTSNFVCKMNIGK